MNIQAFVLMFSLFYFQNCLAQEKSGRFEYFSFGSKRVIRTVNKKIVPILLVRFHKIETGVQHHVFTLYKKLYEMGIDVHIVVAKGTKLQKRLLDAKLPHFAISGGTSSKELKFYTSSVAKICDNFGIKIIHVNGFDFELKIAQALAKKFNLMIVQQYHSYKVFDFNLCSNIDALILSSPALTADLQNKKENGAINPGIIKFIPPICDNEKFLKFCPKYSRSEFFEQKLKIKIKNCPVICMIANFYYCKNHQTFLEAIHELIYVEKMPVQVVLAGSGPARSVEKYKALCKKLKIAENVYFVGYVGDIPELLFHSDIKVLPSWGESFSIAIVEAALMKKPIVLSRTAGTAGLIIEHEKSGLLCDPQKFKDIALQIKRLINDPRFAKSLGENAYEFVLNNLSIEKVSSHYLDLYKQVIEHKNVIAARPIESKKNGSIIEKSEYKRS